MVNHAEAYRNRRFTLLELQLSTSEHDLVTRRREYCRTASSSIM